MILELINKFTNHLLNKKEIKQKSKDVKEKTGDIEEQAADNPIPSMAAFGSSLPKTYIPFVAPSPHELRMYHSGISFIKSSYAQTLYNIVGSLMYEYSDGDEDAINEDSLPLAWDIYNTMQRGNMITEYIPETLEFDSLPYNGICPNGEQRDLKGMDDKGFFDLRMESLLQLQKIHEPSDNTVHGKDEFAEDFFFSVTCHKCGTPHNYYEDVPHQNLDCTLCGQPLVRYAFEENHSPQKKEEKTK
jgi:hypothetical protein